MRKLLIAEGLEDLRIMLQDALRKEYHVTACGDGVTALDLLNTLRPDAMILDLSLPNLSGLSVLEEAPILPPVILCTAIVLPPYTAQAAADHGVGFIALKPCPVRAVVNRLNDMVRKWENPSPTPLDTQSIISWHLRRLGVELSHDGGVYLRVGIPLFAQDPTQRLGKELYTSISARCGGSESQIEFNIRKVITAAWDQRNEAVWAEYFPPDPDSQSRCPTIKKFLARLAEELTKT